MIRFDQKPQLAPLLVGFAIWLVSTLAAADHLKMREDGVAILGYDTVAYFTEGRPMQGKPEFEYVWGGSRWWFATAEHSDLFARNPEQYAPQFGGYCTGGLSLGYKMVADPENWQIVHSQLYLHHSKKSLDKAVADPEPIIAKAEDTWNRLGDE
jgi:YHS domain-containing protein